jgi:2-polyprenyl-6-methoxyphenol hydroxylase-like FAD-dependent oxidoreductase
MRAIGEHAVVLGGSMAGLLAAMVLADAYERVTVVERDVLPEAEADAGTDRKGVPQGRHAHVLLPRGQRVLDELFPGLGDELIRGGAVVADPGTEHLFTFGGRTLCPVPGEDRAIQCSRPFLEGRVRDRVRALPDVTVVDGCDVVGLIATDPHLVTGARIIRRDPGSAEQEMAADLVVDAMGRGSRTPTWLDCLGYERPPVDEVRVNVFYASRYVHMPPGALGDGKAVVVGPRPGLSRGMAMAAVEGDRWLVTLAGVQDANRPPADPDGFHAFADSLASPEVCAAIRAARPLGEIVGFRYPADARHRYERLRAFPAGLIVTGDALCSFSPIYAQGMTVAALEALALHRCLARGADGLTRRYFRAAAKAVDDPWRMAVAANLAMPEVEGRRSRAMRILGAYTERVQAAAARDVTVARQFRRVIGMLEPPVRLMRPAIMARALQPARG